MQPTINFPEGVVTTKTNRSTLSLIIAIIVIAIALIISSGVIDFSEGSPMSSLIICIATAMLVTAAMLSFSLKQTVCIENNAPVVFKSLEFNQSDLERIKRAINNNNWSEVSLLSRECDGSSMKIELAYTKKCDFVAYQYFKYIPHNYEPCSDIVYIDKGQDVTLNIA